jgi:hypothetical protein
MAPNNDIEKPADVPALFAEITALLEDAHEIAVRGQNAKLRRTDYLESTDELNKMLDRVRSLSAATKRALR